MVSEGKVTIPLASRSNFRHSPPPAGSEPGDGGRVGRRVRHPLPAVLSDCPRAEPRPSHPGPYFAVRPHQELPNTRQSHAPQCMCKIPGAFVKMQIPGPRTNLLHQNLLGVRDWGGIDIFHKKFAGTFMARKIGG